MKSVQQVNVRAVGEDLLDSLRRIYHHSCQYKDTTDRTASLLTVLLFVETLTAEVWDDFRYECEADGLDPELIMSKLPEVARSTVLDFFDEKVGHDGEAPQFTFYQLGIGNA